MENQDPNLQEEGQEEAFLPPIKSDQGNKVSIDEFNPMEERQAPKSPRTLLACKAEGILPKQLLHKPLEAYVREIKNPDLAKIRYDFFERKRAAMIETVKEKRIRIIEGEMEKTMKMNDTFNSTVKNFGIKSLNHSQSLRQLDQSLMSSPLPKTTMMKTSASGFFTPAKTNDQVKKAKIREAKVMIGLLKNEEIRSHQIKEQDKQYKNFLQRMKEKEEETRRRQREQNEKKKQIEYAQELRLKEKEKLERERIDRIKQNQNQVIKQQEMKLQQKEEELEKLRQEKEHRRQQKKQVQQTLLEQHQKRQDQKQKEQQKKLEEMERNFQKQKEELSKISHQKQLSQDQKRQHAFEQQVKQEKERQKQYKKIQQERIERERQLQKEQEKKQLEYQKELEEKHKKLRATLEGNHKQIEEYKNSLKKKQIEAEKRVQEIQKERDYEFLKKKELKKAELEFKLQQQAQNNRKLEFQKEQLEAKILLEKLKHQEMNQIMDQTKREKVKALFDAELKRGTLRETLHEMAVWNINDTKVIKEVCGTFNEDGTEIAPKKPVKMSVPTYVRKKASFEAIIKKKNARRTLSFSQGQSPERIPEEQGEEEQQEE